MAKTQNSLSDDAKKLGRPRDFTVTVRDAKLAAGAGFVVAYAGDILTMPGLPKTPGAERWTWMPTATSSACSERSGAAAPILDLRRGRSSRYGAGPPMPSAIRQRSPEELAAGYTRAHRLLEVTAIVLFGALLALLAIRIAGSLSRPPGPSRWRWWPR